MMRMRRVALLFLALSAGLAWFAPVSHAEDMTWTVTSDYKYKVQIEFYSQTRNTSWPGAGKAYTLNDYSPHKFSLSCRAGERICYGAWATGDSKTYWGVGANDKHSCKSCCAVCGESNPVKRLVQD